MKQFLKKFKNQHLVIYILLFLTGFCYWLTQINFLELQLSSVGYTSLAVIHTTFDPIVSKIDFPQGVHNIKKSLPMNIYFWFHEYTNFSFDVIKLKNELSYE